MFDEQDKDALVQEILDEAILEWIDAGKEYGVENIVLEYPDGEPCFVYEGESAHGYGEILCYYRPRMAVKKILEECEYRFGNLPIDVFIKDKGHNITVRHGDLDWERGVREKRIKDMAWVATVMLLTNLQLNFAYALEANFDDSLLMAEAAVSSASAEILASEGATRCVVNPQEDIKELAAKAANKRRKHLSNILRAVPYSRVPTWKAGRPEGSVPSKSLDEVRRENEHHKARMLEAMHRLYEEKRATTNLLIAEDSITRLAVANDMRISRTTLNAWLNAGGYDFELLKEEAVNMSRRNSP
jgi:hypothetical protein